MCKGFADLSACLTKPSDCIWKHHESAPQLAYSFGCTNSAAAYLYKEFTNIVYTRDTCNIRCLANGWCASFDFGVTGTSDGKCRIYSACT